MESDNLTENKSITCFKLPEIFVLDKQETKKFFAQFGSIKSFILKPNRFECTVEFETVDAAQKALNSNASFEIVPTKPEFLKLSEDFIDPDVQSELEAMLPVGMKTSKLSMGTLIKNPFKVKMYPSKPKSEPLNVLVQIDQRLIQNAKSDLENLTRKPAITAEEKFAVLDARDKLYRVMNAKPADLKNVSSTKGTCKDMCPEKERLMREARLQVASFELDDENKCMDAKKAIKQYSRSSADQEIPLPHELRSQDVLKTTMTYLLHNIINLCEDEDVSVGDWYHFVWDRTRGIRKDITQQELCSLTTVELLEQCARFHIHCSARLIAEDPGIFDQKINDENLTKSLQTLKYMYDDLKVKNVKCPNEAEFRAYVVLLNLNESGNFLWEIKRLEKDILHSDEMKFALDVYFAVALNNYVKFFNLVREASYMNACILLKYFTQIRLKAIFTIMRSYTQKRGSKFAFNLSYLTEILCFENYESTANFMSYYGGICDLDGDNVNLNPSTFGSATTPYQMERALETVEYKLEMSIAEAICGNELPAPEYFEKIKPHSSFDANGYLKKDAFYAEDQNGPSLNSDNVFKVPKESPPVSPAANLFLPKNIFSNSIVKNDQSDGIFGNVPFTKTTTSTPFHSETPFTIPKTTSANIFGSGGNNIFGTTPPTPNTNIKSSNIFGTPQMQKPSPPSSETVKVPVINPFIFAKPFGMQDSPKPSIFSGSSPYSSSSNSSSQLYIEETTSDEESSMLMEKQKNEEKLKKEREAAEMMLRKKLAEKAQQEQERRETQKRLEMQKKEEEERRQRELEELKRKKLQEDSEKIYYSLLDEIVLSEVKHEMNMANKIYIKIPKDFYDALEYDVVVEQLFKIYEEEFLSFVNTSKRKYDMMYRNFDHWRKITQKEKHRREKLSNIGCSALNKSLEEHVNALFDPQQSVTLSNMKQYLSGSPLQINVPDLETYNIFDLFTDIHISQMNLPSKLFWKLLVSIPLKNEENSIAFSCFIKKWIGKIFNVPDDQNIFLMAHKNVYHASISICMRKIQGIECLDEKLQKHSNTISSANSLIFFCTTTNLNESRMRLNSILDKADNSLSISIVVYKNIIDASDQFLIQKYFDLSMEPKVKTFEVHLFYECREKSKDLRHVLKESCQFLYDNYLHQLNTEYSVLYDLEMQHLFDFFPRYFGDEMWQRIEFSCNDNKDFSTKMSSFNNVIQVYNSCIDKMIGIISNSYKTLPTFPEEFRSLLPSMEIRIPHSFEYFPSDFKLPLYQKNVISFLHDLKLIRMQNDKFESFKDFQDKLKKFLDINIPSSITCRDQAFHAVVDKIIQHFYLMQLKSNDNAMDKMRWLKIFECIIIGKFNEIFQQKQQDLPTFIVYSKTDMRNYLIPWWFVTNLSQNKAQNQNEPSSKKTKFVQNIDIKDIDSILKKGSDSLKKATEIVNKSRQNTLKTRKDSKAFDQYMLKSEENMRGMKRSLQDKFSD